MKVPDSFNKERVTIFVFILLLIVNTILSLNAYFSARKIEEQYVDFSNALTNEWKAYQTLLSESEKLSFTQKLHTDNFNGEEDDGSALEAEEIKENKPLSSDEIRAIRQIIDMMGIDEWSRGIDFDSVFIERMYEREKDEQYVDARIKTGLEISRKQYQTDTKLYGEELTILFQNSFSDSGRIADNIQNESVKNARDKLLRDYPDSYAAAIVTAWQAMEAGIEGNLEKAETYYHQLKDIQERKEEPIVFSDGIETIPHVGFFLSWQYIDAGFIDKALHTVKVLENGFDDSIYKMRSPDNRFKLVRGEIAFENIRRKIGAIDGHF